jgi:sugar/nucleoside kinase (ribokinase family)
MREPRGLFVGLITLDLVHRVASHLGADEKATAISQELATGGPAANAAITFAALGGTATLVTALGRHPLARFAAAEVQARGVRLVDAAADEVAMPAVSAIRVLDSTGQRSVSSVNAAARSVVPPAELAGLAGDANVVLLDGHHPALALAAARHAQAASVPVLLDAGSWKPVLTELLPDVDAVICSEVFTLPPGTPGVLERGPRLLAVTHGGQPVEWATPKASGTVAVPAVDVRDTLGAGDVFHGAAAYALSWLGLTRWSQVLAFAVRVAARRVVHEGPRAWLADPEVARLGATVAT